MGQKGIERGHGIRLKSVPTGCGLYMGATASVLRCMAWSGNKQQKHCSETGVVAFGSHCLLCNPIWAGKATCLVVIRNSTFLKV